MSELACLGGKPVTKNLVGNGRFASRSDLERKYLLETYDSGVWDDWPGVDSMASRFAREWARFCGARFCALVTNGTHALQLALEALDIGAGDEVIVPGLTWQATAAVVCDVNAVPVLVDVDPRTTCIDPKKVQEAVGPRTRAIMPVHLYNRMADMDRLRRIATKHGLHLIEDCSHTHGSRWKDRAAGALSDIGCFSLQRSKLVTGGEGGAMLMDDEELYWRIASMRGCGRELKAGIRVHSGNYRITSFQAAVLRGQLAALRRNAPRMDKASLALDEAVAAAPGVRPLWRSPKLTRSCGYAFVFLYDARAFDGLPADAFRRALSAELGVRFGSTYVPLHHSDLYRPHTTKRHHITPRYLRAITPSRWELPVCDSLWRDRAVTSSWRIFACPPSRARLLTDAIAKVHERRAELIAAEHE